MAGKGTSGINKWIDIGSTTARILRLVIVVILGIAGGRAFNADAQMETNLHYFVGSPSDGGSPIAGLVQGSDGNFYGTTPSTVFRISPSGSYTTLYSFVGFNDGTGANGLVQGSDGNFYGTTSGGGKSNSDNGTVFLISPSGSYTSLYSFGSQPDDGATPQAGLVQGSDGNFYGTTYEGGSNGVGTVFRISVGGGETPLYSFGTSITDGKQPVAGLVQGTDGSFYGTTSVGGSSNAGSVFRINPSGSYTNLYSFGISPNGETAPNGLIQGSDGNFYGTTFYGGAGSEGTLFRINPIGTYTNLYFFGSIPNDGLHPYAGLVQGSDGNFYGATFGGGTSLDGSVFRISPGGSYTSLYSFVGYPTDGYHPLTGLVQGSDGNFYGTTSIGGTHNEGTVFKLTVPLNPPANQISAMQIATSNVVFNIPSIAYETYQLQFSSSMNPTNWVNVPGVSVTNSIGALLTLTNFGGAVGPQGFYRFDITP